MKSHYLQQLNVEIYTYTLNTKCHQLNPVVLNRETILSLELVSP